MGHPKEVSGLACTRSGNFDIRADFEFYVEGTTVDISGLSKERLVSYLLSYKLLLQWTLAMMLVLTLTFAGNLLFPPFSWC